MPSPIAFVSRSSDSEEADWISVLSKAIPDETILSVRAMSGEHCRDAAMAIVANPEPEDIARLPNLEWIHSLWAGVERLVAELGPSAPPVVRLVDPELTRVMAEAVLAWTYYLHRDMPAYRLQQQRAVWNDIPYRHPKTVTVGLIGLGTLGSAAAHRLTGAGFNVLGWSRSPKTVDGVEALSGETGLIELLGRSDIAVCLLPLTVQTRGLLDASRLGTMKAGAALINFARGAVVVADDLLVALNDGHLAHAVLDVFEKEPLERQSPFWHHPQVTVLPHISAPTDRHSSAAIVASNIRRWRMTGTLPATVDMTRGY